jgi:hypothetical protein
MNLETISDAAEKFVSRDGVIEMITEDEINHGGSELCLVDRRVLENFRLFGG